VTRALDGELVGRHEPARLGLPARVLGRLPPHARELEPEPAAREQPADRRERRLAPPRVVEESVLAAPHQVAKPTGVRSDHRHSRRHRLEHDEAERLGGRGHHEHVGGCVGCGELVAGEEAGEVHRQLPEHAREACAIRPVADQGEARLGQLVHHPGERLDALLAREPAHVEEERLIRAAVGETRAHGERTAAGIEAHRVDAAAPDADPRHALVLQAAARRRRGAEVRVCEPVEGAQPAAERARGEAEPVARRVAHQVGVKGGHERETERAGRERPPGAEAHRPDRVHHVRP